MDNTAKVGNVMVVMLAIEGSAFAFQMFNRSEMAFQLYSQSPTLFAWSEYALQAVTVVSAWFVPIKAIEKENV